MRVEEVSIRKVDVDGKLKAMADICFDKCLVVKGFKVIEGVKGLFVGMPSRKNAGGEYVDTTFPITAEFREELINAILEKYHANDDANDHAKSRNVCKNRDNCPTNHDTEISNHDTEFSSWDGGDDLPF